MILCLGNALDHYTTWESPTIIISDGPYGINGYDGDLKNTNNIGEWYEPHIKCWTEKSTPQTTLWFWNTEIGWAETHSFLKKYGWIYHSCNIWNKGMGHVAGNCNTQTLRKFPVVTEVCVQYIRKPKFINNNTELSAQQWLRSEWLRTGLPLNTANTACEVKNAATRKYLTEDHLWYFPPPEIFQKLSDYANKFGEESGKPYFAIDGTIISGSQWRQLRSKFQCPIGITNVWNIPTVRGKERIKTKTQIIHPNQKPLSIMEMIISCSSEEGDVIWEPFGGLCTASIAGHDLNRKTYAAEINECVYNSAKKRFSTHRKFFGKMIKMA